MLLIRIYSTYGHHLLTTTFLFEFLISMKIILCLSIGALQYVFVCVCVLTRSVAVVFLGQVIVYSLVGASSEVHVEM